MRNYSLLVRIAAAMIGGLLLSQLAITVFFPGKTPVLRANLSPYLREQTDSFLSRIPKLLPHIDLAAILTSTTPPSPNQAAPNTASAGYLVVGERSIGAEIKQELATQKPRTLSPGIYVSGNSTSFLTTVKQSEVKWTSATYVINGKPVQLRVPAGQPAPPAQLVNSLY